MKDLTEQIYDELNAQVVRMLEHSLAQASRIAELERQLAEASVPAVGQQPVKPWEDRMEEYFAQGSVRMRTPVYFMADEIIDWRKITLATPQAADTDKVREAILKLNPHEKTVLGHAHGAGAYCEGFDHGIAAAAELAASMASQAPVREVPEPEPDMLWDAENPEDGVTGHSPKNFAENYAGAAMGRGETHDVEVLCCNRTHNRTMRVSVSADEDAENWLHWEWVDALPAAPVQQEGAIPASNKEQA